MKKTLSIICLIILAVSMAGIAIAGPALDAQDKTATLSKARVQALESIGIGEIKNQTTNETISTLSVGETLCDGAVCRAKLYQEDGINKDVEFPQGYDNCIEYALDEMNESACNSTETIEYNATELKALRDEAIDKLLNRLAEITISRQNRAGKIAKLGSGNVTIEEAGQ